MKVQLELAPDVGERLLERARAAGLSLDQFAARALEAVARADSPARRASPEERAEAFDEFVEGFESNAALPEAAFDREGWYPDR